MRLVNLLLTYNPVKSLRVTLKLGLCLCLFLCLIFFLSWNIYHSELTEIEKRRNQILATHYITVVYDIIKNTQVVRGLTNAKLNGSSNIESKILQQRQEVFDKLEILYQIINKHGNIAQAKNEASTFEDKFKKLNQIAFSSQQPDKIFQSYTDLVTQLRNFLKNLGDESDLTLVEDTDIYYLVDFLIYKAHRTAEAMGVLRGVGSGVIASSVYDPKKIISFSQKFGDSDQQSMLDALKKSTRTNEKIKSLLEESIVSINQKSDAFSKELYSIIENNTSSLTSSEYFSLGTAYIEEIYNTVIKVDAILTDILKERLKEVHQEKFILLTTICVLLIISLYIFSITMMAIVDSLHRTRTVLKSVSEGDFDNILSVHTKDEFEDLAHSVNETQKKLKAQIEQERQVAQVNHRIRQALDNVTTKTLIVDSNLSIVYLNDALYDMFKLRYEALHSNFVDFNLETIQHLKFSIFDTKTLPLSEKVMMLQGTEQLEVIVNEFVFILTVNPVFDEDNNRIGAVIEWEDRTEEIGIQSEIEDLIQSASQGDLDKKISMENKKGFFLELSKGLNRLVDISNGVVSDIGRIFSALSNGDLTQYIEKDYKGAYGNLKNDINTTISQLTEVMSQIRIAASTVSSGADEISQGNTDLSQRTEEQASSLEETASSMEEMTSAVKSSAENAAEANSIAQNTKLLADSGGKVVQEAVSAMSKINESSKHIADIIGVIDEIAFQTNLLALNAAVEAARAGEQGRGFAVVASEVRNLAQRSAAAAKEIKDLIRDSVDKVTIGSKLVNQSGETLENIVASVEKVSTMVKEISISAAEQSTGIEQVSTAITQMDDMTQQNAALVEQVTAAGESMADQSRKLTEQVQFFKVNEQQTHDANRTIPPVSKSRNPESTSAHRLKTDTDSTRSVNSQDMDSDWEEF